MTKKLAGIAFASCLAAGSAHASQLIVNGGFETGTLSGWTVTTQTGSFTGTGFYADSLTTTPESGSPTAGPKTGADYAVSDASGGPGTAILSQTFTVPVGMPSVILSYSLFVNSYGGDVIDPAGDLNYSGAANQYALVSLLSAGASLFSTTTGDLANFYKGTDAGTNPNPYTNYSFNITSLVTAGQTYTLRFAESDNVNILNMGVDNVSVVSSASALPEPASSILAFLGITGICLFRSRRYYRG
jgi:hypothetical protein